MLANASLGLILVLLYSLGGVSLFLRSRYLAVENESVAPTPTATPPERAVEVGWTPPPTPTLYPTLTPRSQGAAGR